MAKSKSIADFKHAEKVGAFAFFLGIALAVIAGLPGDVPAATAIMAPLILTIFGFIVGFLNITDDEVKPFLIAAIALMIVAKGGLEELPYIGAYLVDMLKYILLFVSASALVVSLKAIYDIAKSRK
ncbi:MAG: hypothetical protein KAJ20_00255 [Candidatus Aenigmarchaeota archaeon]|nr:hypothetical protein [Candidatus Aenigmarchaeota archaeon]MCK5372750.1 hypothetical protein [Candidatus Aenigmarchaeota archaeon]MCK5451813.1 hypothetical protein [Candidatus Aenigmarchaeota archaeon]